jgi:hypothetical protein
LQGKARQGKERCGTYTPDGVLREEARWSTPAAWLAVVERGLVAEWRVYADNEPIRRRMTQLQTTT